MTPYFTQDFIAFFRGLEENNDREWFNAHKKQYEAVVKAPFEEFVKELIDRMHEQDHRILLTPKDAIFRIYKDTRFSADKTPYKIFTSAVIAPGGRKDPNADGIYLELGGRHARIYSGAYQPEKDQLLRIREKIAAEPKRFNALISDKVFITHFGEIRGEKNKVLPATLKEAAQLQPLIYNKAFYYFTEWPPESIVKKDFMADLLKRYQIIKPLTAFIIEAVQNND